MTALDVFSELMQLGCDARLEGDNIRIISPQGVTLSPSLRQAIKQNKAGLVALLRKLEAAKATRLLREQGWVLIYSHALGEPVLWLRDEAVHVPEELQGVPAYTLAELKTLLAEPVPTEDDLRLLHQSKQLFKGTFLEAKA